MDGTKRAHIRPGQRAQIVLKQDQASGKLTEGIVQNILTSSPSHPHGIPQGDDVKVRLVSEQVGRARLILGE
jgi:uncharacterized repeat protein (TIGR03833 family)